jgi:hypothetical protein
VEFQDLAAQYQGKTDEELLRLALDPSQLTPEASTLLKLELARRSIDSEKHLSAFREEQEQYDQEQKRATGNLFVLHPYGIGRMRFGKAERTHDPDTGMERFRTTVFIVLFWLPLIPTGTFLVERKRSFFSKRIRVLERLPLDWEQVLTIWVVASGILLALIWGLKLLPRLLFRR